MMNNERSARDDWRDDRVKKGERIQESEIKLRVASEEENRLNAIHIEGCTDETLRELIDLRDAADTVIKSVQKTIQEADVAEGRA